MIMVDLVGLHEDPLTNIYCAYDEANIHELDALIVGPEGTPYHGGFYCFRINFTTRYPFEPPRVRFLTNNPTARFNPNLYESGKVCLSILGTWEGPGWTSAMNLKSLLLSLQSLLSTNPLRNEPGMEKENPGSVRNKDFNEIVSYYNISDSIIKTLAEPHVPRLKDVIHEYFLKNAGQYESILGSLKDRPNRTVRSCYQALVNMDWATARSGLERTLNTVRSDGRAAGEAVEVGKMHDLMEVDT